MDLREGSDVTQKRWSEEEEKWHLKLKLKMGASSYPSTPLDQKEDTNGSEGCVVNLTKIGRIKKGLSEKRGGNELFND